MLRIYYIFFFTILFVFSIAIPILSTIFIANSIKNKKTLKSMNI